MGMERQMKQKWEKDLLAFLRHEGYKKHCRHARWQLAWHLFAALSLSLSHTDKIQHSPWLFLRQFWHTRIHTHAHIHTWHIHKSSLIICKLNVRNLQYGCLRWPLQSALLLMLSFFCVFFPVWGKRKWNLCALRHLEQWLLFLSSFHPVIDPRCRGGQSEADTDFALCTKVLQHIQM